MKKHIQISVCPTPNSDFQKLDITITQQSHIGTSFGNINAGMLTSEFKAKNGVTLASCNYPEYHESERNLFLKGNWTGSKVTVPTKDFPAIKAAIEEYNKTFANDCPLPCVTIVG